MNYWVLTWLLCMQYICNAYGSYFWRDYEKKIPSDAYLAGQNSNNENVYIGRATLCAIGVQGVYPTSIVEGKDIFVPREGARKANHFVQILCTDDPSKFEWIPATSSHLHLLNTDNKMIRGGYECTGAKLAIGRVRIEKDTVVGKVLLNIVGLADMWFTLDELQQKAISYEVLTYKPTNPVMVNGTIRSNFI